MRPELEQFFKNHDSNRRWLRHNTIIVSLTGSQAYGTATPKSDYDFKGFCVAPASYYRGFTDHFKQAESRDPDVVWMGYDEGYSQYLNP